MDALLTSKLNNIVNIHECFYGVLREVPLFGLSPKIWVARECESLRLEPWYFDKPIDALNDYYASRTNDKPRYHIINDRLFEVEDVNEIEEEKDVSVLRPLSGERYFFLLRYYQEDTTFSERLAEELYKIDKQLQKRYNNGK